MDYWLRNAGLFEPVSVADAQFTQRLIGLGGYNDTQLYDKKKKTLFYQRIALT